MIWFETPIDLAAIRERRLQKNCYIKLFSPAMVENDGDRRSNRRRPWCEFLHERRMELSVHN
ncbi:unnamed protein product [Brassica rapa subsp. trilocularis]